MANSFTVQTVEEGARNVIVRLAGVLDTSNLSVQTAVNPADYTQGSTAPAPTGLRIDRIEYSVAPQIAVQLLWDATTDVTFAALTGNGGFDFQRAGGLQNNAGAGKTGIINILTSGWASGIQDFTVLLCMVKLGV